jgi:hypothetical protein
VYNRIEIPLRAHPVLALTANLPWFLLGLFCLAAASRQPALWYIAGLACMAVGGWRTTRALRSGAGSMAGLIVERERLSIRYRDGRTQAVRVAPESRLGSRLSILKLVPEAPISAPVSVVLSTLPGMSNTNACAFRRLRVWLRLGSAQNGDRPQQSF